MQYTLVENKESTVTLLKHTQQFYVNKKQPLMAPRCTKMTCLSVAIFCSFSCLVLGYYDLLPPLQYFCVLCLIGAKLRHLAFVSTFFYSPENERNIRALLHHQLVSWCVIFFFIKYLFKIVFFWVNSWFRIKHRCMNCCSCNT